jgi:hypothetical protein
MSAGGRSRTAAIALLVGVFAVIGAAVVVPAALYWTKTGSIIRDARMKVLRSERRAEAERTMTESRSAWDRFVATPNSGFTLANSDEQGVAAAKERARALFARLGGSASAIEAEASDGPREGVRAIAVELRGTLPREQLGPFLAALESEAPFVVVQRFSATSTSGNRLKLSISGTTYRLMEGTS